MKVKYLIFLVLLICTQRAFSQPPETTYTGNLIASGYLNNIPLASDGPFPIGFNFTFFGNSYSQFYVSANGLIMFEDPSANFSTEVTIPNAAAPNNYIAPFWDDLVIDSYGKILYTTIGAAPNRKLVIQFKNMGFYPFPATFGTFAVILYETSNVIQVQYRLIVDYTLPRAHGESATIGIENATGSAGVLYAYHNPTAITNEQAISFTPSGPTYTVNPGAVYEGAYLTTNISLPEPGITNLVSPPQDAVIGSDFNFQWDAASYAANYSLIISNSSDLTGGVSYNAGTNLNYNVTGLNLNETFYWGVFASNATGLTWCEIKKFTTASSPPLVPVPQTVWAEQPLDKAIQLQYTGGDASAKTAVIRSLPAQGQLYQYNAGARGAQITLVPTNVTDAGMRVVYSATGGAGNGVGNFNFLINDANGDSPEATVTVNVSPPGVPNVLYVAKNAGVEIQFDIAMANPAGKQGQFQVTVNSVPATINSAALKTGDGNTIVLSLASPLTGTETVTVSYTQGDVTSSSGGVLLSFTDIPVTLLAQTINLPTLLDKKYGDAPFVLSASATSGLGMTYSSSNLTVATIATNLVTIHSVGTSSITARQAGNATYAPAKFVKTLTVAKGDQTIAFNPLAGKTYGDSDFAVSATASSGLAVTFTGDNPVVATVTGNMVYITGGGSVNITASQSGNSLWNPAPNVVQPLTVAKVPLTITAEDKTKDYLAPLPALTFTISGFVNGEDQSVIDQLPIIGTTALQNSPGGTYPITPTGGSDNSYSFNYTAGTLTINPIAQTITFGPLPDKIMMNSPVTLEATSTSGLPVLFESLDPSYATVAGDQLTGIAPGDASVRAYNDGDQNYLPAEALAFIEISSTHRDIMFLFTPNNDGINDYWELPDLYKWGKCNVKVYNRWGKLVYANYDYNNMWDGISNGSPVPEGPYYFIIETENAGIVKGTLNIVR